MSYCKIGKFKPGDIIISARKASRHKTTTLKVIGIKRRKKIKQSLYRLKFLDNNAVNFSRNITVIDNVYDLSLKQTLKNL